MFLKIRLLSGLALLVSKIGFACLLLHSDVLNLIWHGDFWEVCDELLGFPKEVSCVDNPSQCDHIHCIHSI